MPGVAGYETTFAGLEPRLKKQDPAWVHELRRTGLERFRELGFPSLREEELDAMDFLALTKDRMKQLGMDGRFLERAVNEGFSGGEKKRCEILQMAMLEPKIALMDETDSGLDIDALRIVADGVNAQRSSPSAPGIMLITHYQRLLDYIIPDFVHVMHDGRLVKSGNKSLALELEAKGYDWVKEEFTAANI